MASPNKNMKTGDYNQGFEGGTGGYKPFQMKAAGHNNSPIEKNYGSPAQRGMDMNALGTKSKEMDGGVGSAFDFASPAKGFWDKVKSLGKKALNPLSIFKKNKKDAAVADATGTGDGVGGAGGVQPHGDEMHTGGDSAMQGGGMQKQPGAGMSAFGTSGVGNVVAQKNKAQDSMWGGIMG